MKTTFATVMLAMTLSACSRSAEQQSDLNSQAMVIHNTMIGKSNEIGHRLLELLRDPAFVQQRDSIRAAMELLETWKGELVEVPGNEAHEHEHQHHDHAHRSPDLTAEQMLAIQEELRFKLNLIEERVQRIKTRKQD